MSYSNPMRGVLAAALTVLLAGATLLTAVAQEPPLDPALREQVLSIPGDSADPVMLQVTMFLPSGPGPFPLAVLNHGKELGQPRDEPRYRSAYIARYFLSRGYAVVLPMLRGFAGSDGTFDPHGCNVELDGLTQAADIAAVIADVSRQPIIDARRIVVSGQSFGGWNTLALGTLDVPGVRGLLNFSGGARQPKCGAWGANLIDAAADYGRRTKLPSMEFYGDNDQVFPSGVWHGMYRAYTAAGGRAPLVDYGRFMDNAHELLSFPEGLPIWTPQVDAFLGRIGLPNLLLNPGYLPAESPPPSHFAAIDDLAAIPYLGDSGRKTYQQFLTKKQPRVFVIGDRRGAISSSGGFDPLTRAITICRRYFSSCKPYAVDDQVVWTGR